VWFKPDVKGSAVIGYLSDQTNAEAIKVSIQNYLDELKTLGFQVGQSKINLRKIKEEDWSRGWKKSFKPIFVTENMVILPDWDKSVFPDKIVIRIKPGMAFGTGDHATTQLCIRALSRFLKPKDKIIDVGCGSGILSIVSARLGASYALGLDIDQDAIENANENLALNQVEETVTVRLGTANAGIPEAPFDLAVANINRIEIVESYDRIAPLVKPGGMLIFSGILEGEEGYMTDFFARQKLKHVEVTHQDEWMCFVGKQ
jgi:ribosomal protein L11 methyltransferase